MAEVKDLVIRPGGYEFRISGSPHAFKRALEKIKEIPHGDGRIYDAELRVWFVSDRWREKLASIFTNFEAAVEAIECQGILF
jgi:hypothetical protein